MQSRHGITMGTGKISAGGSRSVRQGVLVGRRAYASSPMVRGMNETILFPR